MTNVCYGRAITEFLSDRTAMEPEKESNSANASPGPHANWLTTLKKPWVWLIAAIGGTALLLTNINTIMINARSLPSEIRKTSHKFESWYHDDAAWTGRWSNSPDSYVDEEDLNLSKEPITIAMKVVDGEIAGVISTQAICDRVPVFEFLMLSGEVSGSNEADVKVWDVVGGHDTYFGRLHLERDEIVMNVTLKDGNDVLSPPSARIALIPGSTGEASEQKGELCPGKQEKIFNMLKKIADKGQPVKKSNTGGK